MKRIIFSLLTAAICNASSLFAQQTEKTITIQTNGQEDVIDLPEGLIATTWTGFPSITSILQKTVR